MKVVTELRHLDEVKGTLELLTEKYIMLVLLVLNQHHHLNLL